MKAAHSGSLFHYEVYKKNSVLKLIFGLMIVFILMQILSIIFMILASNANSVMNTMMIPNTAILDWNYFILKPWTIFTYGILHESFWLLLPNVIWLYLFGSIYQRFYYGPELPYLFIFTSIIAAIIYLIVLKIMGTPGKFILTAAPGVMSIATATLLLVPNYRVLIGSMVSIPLWVFYIIFVALSIMVMGYNDIHSYLLLGASGILGGIYSLLIKNKKLPGYNLEQLWRKMGDSVQPKNRPVNKYGWSSEKMVAEAIRKNPNEKERIMAIGEKLEKDGIGALTVSEKILIFGL